MFNERLGVDEAEFLASTNGSIKIGIKFENWRQLGDSYIHTFGRYGLPINRVPFHHYWVKMRQLGDPTRFEDYTITHVAGEMDRFEIRPYDENSVRTNYLYALHFDAGLYAQYLRKGAEQRGVQRTEGNVVDVKLNGETGYIESVRLEDGETIAGDLFIDCSGFRALLSEGALQTGYEDWSHWLPCNRAWAVSTTYRDGTTAIPPYTRARALQAGWQWRIPLQNRTGDGHVFCNEYLDEEQARETLLENVEGETLFEPRLLKFRTGRRNKIWNKNCVAIGLAAGFLEPLESTSLFLTQLGIMRLIRCFPDLRFNPAQRDEYNFQIHEKFEEARDFLVLHYNATVRDDTPFWNYCRTMEVPEELKFRMDLFRARGHVACKPSELFIESSWLAVMVGQGLIPENYDPRVDGADESAVRELMSSMHAEIQQSATSMATHVETLATYCRGDLLVSAA